MKRSTLNYWVDLATGAAFLVCAVTGIVFLFPAVVHTSIGASPSILLTPALWWHKVHDWSGVVMVAGTALHLALHARWIATMTRRTFGAGAGTAAAGAVRPTPAERPSPAAPPSPVIAAADAAQIGTYATPHAADAAAAASLRRLADLRAERHHEHEQRRSRRRFLAGAGAVGGLALLAGAGLIGRDVMTAAAATSDTSTSSGGASGGASNSTAGGSGGQSGGSGQGSAGYGQSTGGSQSASSSGSARVVVNDSACVACGRCMQICPQGVFDWSGAGRAAAQNPDACIRCGRCLQVCPAGAITVSA